MTTSIVTEGETATNKERDCPIVLDSAKKKQQLYSLHCFFQTVRRHERGHSLLQFPGTSATGTASCCRSCPVTHIPTAACLQQFAVAQLNDDHIVTFISEGVYRTARAAILSLFSCEAAVPIALPCRYVPRPCLRFMLPICTLPRVCV